MVASESTRPGPQIFSEDAQLPMGSGSLGIEGWAFLEVGLLPFFRPLGQLVGIVLPAHIHHERSLGPQDIEECLDDHVRPAHNPADRADGGVEHHH